MAVYEMQRCERFGWYMIEHQATIRQTAKALGAAKSTVYKDLSVTLPQVNYLMWLEVRKILDKNKAERHYRGGAATKRKYELAKLRSVLNMQQRINREIIQSLKKG